MPNRVAKSRYSKVFQQKAFLQILTMLLRMLENYFGVFLKKV
jgi:hypothetical protein